MSSQTKVLVAMGSQSDWPTMRHCADLLEALRIKHIVRIISAHRTPHRVIEYADRASTGKYQIIIAGAGGAAHLPGMFAAHSDTVPVIGVPIQSKALSGWDSMLSIVQMPPGVPVATMAIGDPGAKNAAILAAQILALDDPELRVRLAAWRQQQTESVTEEVKKD